MGGIHTATGTKRVRQSGNRCRHSETMSTFAAGLERIVCETCGHLSFRWHEDVSDFIDRERTRDVSASEPDSGLFALQAGFHIRSRYELFPEASAIAV